jgi:hypothetical protein
VITSPAVSIGSVDVWTLVTARPGAAGIGVTTAGSEVSVTGARLGAVPVAVAVLVTEPLSTSVWVTVCVYSQVTVAAGASDVGRAGVQVVRTAVVSVMSTPASVTLPVFVAVTE